MWVAIFTIFTMWLEVVCLQAVEKVQRIVDILGSCHHNGFPVLENGTKKMEAWP